MLWPLFRFREMILRLSLYSDFKALSQAKETQKRWCHSYSSRTLKQRLASLMVVTSTFSETSPAIFSPTIFISIHPLIFSNRSFCYSGYFTPASTKSHLCWSLALQQTHSPGSLFTCFSFVFLSCQLLSATTISSFRSPSSPPTLFLVIHHGTLPSSTTIFPFTKPLPAFYCTCASIVMKSKLQAVSWVLINPG